MQNKIEVIAKQDRYKTNAKQIHSEIKIIAMQRKTKSNAKQTHSKSKAKQKDQSDFYPANTAEWLLRL